MTTEILTIRTLSRSLSPARQFVGVYFEFSLSLSGIFPSSDWPLWRGTGGGSPGEQGAGILSFGTIQKRRENVVREAGDSDPPVPPPH